MSETCETCGGSGFVMVPVPKTVYRCCGRAGYECGGLGCTGPEPEQDVEYEGAVCETCGGQPASPPSPPDVVSET